MPELSLEGFDTLDPSELEIVKKIVANKIKKIKINYQFLKIRLKQHVHKYEHSTRIIHELQADLFFSKNKALSSKSEDANLYKALDDVMEKILAEIKHKFKK